MALNGPLVTITVVTICIAIVKTGQGKIVMISLLGSEPSLDYAFGYLHVIKCFTLVYSNSLSSDSRKLLV